MFFERALVFSNSEWECFSTLKFFPHHSETFEIEPRISIFGSKYEKSRRKHLGCQSFYKSKTSFYRPLEQLHIWKLKHVWKISKYFLTKFREQYSLNFSGIFLYNWVSARKFLERFDILMLFGESWRKRLLLDAGIPFNLRLFGILTLFDSVIIAFWCPIIILKRFNVKGSWGKLIH